MQFLLSFMIHTYLSTMGMIIQVSFTVRVRHTSGVATHNVEVRPSSHTSFSVPLYLEIQTQTQSIDVKFALGIKNFILGSFNCSMYFTPKDQSKFSPNDPAINFIKLFLTQSSIPYLKTLGRIEPFQSQEELLVLT